MVSEALFVGSLIFSVTGVTLLLIVLALQLSLSQWGSADSYSSYSSRKRRIDVPIVWTTLCLTYLSLCNAISTSIWHGELWMERWNGHVWCDIDIRLQLAASSGILTGATAIARNLCLIISAKSSPHYFQSKKKIWIDTLICVTLPVIQVACVYLIQPYRYGITEIFGCTLIIYLSIPTIILYVIWVPIWALVAAGYASTCVYLTYRRKKDFQNILMFTGSGLSTFQFIRILSFNLVIICAMLPLALATSIVRTAHSRVDTHYNLDEVHTNFQTVVYFAYKSSSLVERWMYGTFAYVAFMTFGLGAEARMTYMKILDLLHIGWIVRLIGNYIKLGFLILVPKTIREKFQTKNNQKVLIPPQYRKGNGNEDNDFSSPSQIIHRLSHQSHESSDPYVEGQFCARFEYQCDVESQTDGYYFNDAKDGVSITPIQSAVPNSGLIKELSEITEHELLTTDISELDVRKGHSAPITSIYSLGSEATAFSPSDQSFQFKNSKCYTFIEEEEKADTENLFGVEESLPQDTFNVSNDANEAKQQLSSIKLECSEANAASACGVAGSKTYQQPSSQSISSQPSSHTQVYYYGDEEASFERNSQSEPISSGSRLKKDESLETVNSISNDEGSF